MTTSPSLTKLALAGLLLLSLGERAQAQVHGGLKGGLNLSTLDGTLNPKTDLRPSYHAGAFVTAWIGKHAAFQPEVLYSEQGTKFSTLTSTTENTLRMSVIQVPMLLKLATAGHHLNFHIGPQFSVLVSAEEENVSNGGAKAVISDVKYRYKNGEFAVVAGVGAEVNRFSFDVRGIAGLSDINNDPTEAAVRAAKSLGGLHHRLVQVSVGVRLF